MKFDFDARFNYTNIVMRDVLNRQDLERLIADFYDEMLQDPIVGHIFVDVAAIDLQHHLPIIVNFWQDALFRQADQKKSYTGNALAKHLELSEKIPLKAGHFTRWLYLFFQAIDRNFEGPNAELMKTRAELVAKSISAAIDSRKKSELNLVLGRESPTRE